MHVAFNVIHIQVHMVHVSNVIHVHMHLSGHTKNFTQPIIDVVNK